MFKLGLNTGFAVNRYSEHDIWTRIIGEDLGLRYAQLTADMLNPDLPAPILTRHVREINESGRRYDVQIPCTFTGAFTRVNHLAHPDAEVRAHWIKWFKTFIDLSVDLGAESAGSHFGIFTDRDNRDPKVRAERRQQNIDGWHELARYAQGRGLKFLTWEPMSISREQGETLSAARELQSDVNRSAALPFRLTLDVDHGDVTSSDVADIDPYRWLADFAADSPYIHLKQSLANKGGHWPFTAEYNLQGKIQPERVLKTLEQHGNSDAYLFLELSFREREPADSRVIEVLRESTLYWRDTVPA